MAQNEMLSALLNDPQALETAMRMASSLLGGAPPASDDGQPSATGETAAPDVSAPPPFVPAFSPDQPAEPISDPSAELMARALPVLSRIAQSGQTAIDPAKRSLLHALKPFVSQQIAVQIDHGIRLVSLARMARTVIGGLHPSGEEERHV